MNKYVVTISFRPHFNRLARETKTFRVTADNKTGAVFQAGYKLGQARESFLLTGSEQIVSVTRV